MKTMPFTIAARRGFAIRAARSEARRHNWATLTADEALQVLDDLYRSEPELIASQWYAKASKTQLNLFVKEWDKQTT
jgi:hypothetical protein